MTNTYIDLFEAPTHYNMLTETRFNLGGSKLVAIKENRDLIKKVWVGMI